MYYVADFGKSVFEATITRTGILLSDGRELSNEDIGNKLFAIHPKDNPRCQLVDGVWHYMGLDGRSIIL